MHLVVGEPILKNRNKTLSLQKNRDDRRPKLSCWKIIKMVSILPVIQITI